MVSLTSMRRLGVLFSTIVLSFSLIILLATGCAPKKVATDHIVLEMWIMPNSQEPVADLESVIAAFEKKHPKIKVKITSLDWGSAWQKITTAAISSDAPDVVQLGSTWVGSITSMGANLDLKPMAAQINAQKMFVPAAWSTTGVVGSGQVNAIPWLMDVRALYYRTDVFKKLGLSAKDIDTWEGLQATLRKIKKAELVINGKKIQPLGITGKNDWNVIHNLAPWIWAGGGEFLSKDLKTSNINSLASVKGINFYTNLVKEGLVPLDCLELNTAQVSSAFNNGNYAIYIDGPYALKTLTTPPERGGSADLPVAKNFAVAPYPKSPQGLRATFLGGSNLAVFKSSKNKKEAWELIKFLTTDKEAQVAYSKLTGFLPALVTAFDDPYFSNDPFRKIYKDSVKFGKTYPCVPAWGPLETVVLTRRFGLFWDRLLKDPKGFDQEAIQDELNVAAKEMNSVLKKY